MRYSLIVQWLKASDENGPGLRVELTADSPGEGRFWAALTQVVTVIANTVLSRPPFAAAAEAAPECKTPKARPN